MNAARKLFGLFMYGVAAGFVALLIFAWAAGTKVAIVPKDFDVERAVAEWELQREGDVPL